MSIQKTVFLLLLAMLSCLDMGAQKAVKKQADKYFNAKNYREAHRLFQSLDLKDENDLIRKGIAAYECNQMDMTIASLGPLVQSNFKDDRIDYYLAKAYMAKGNYEEAAYFFKRVLGTSYEKEFKKDALKQLHICGHGKQMGFVESLAFVENMGDKVNTVYDEINPKQSPNFQNKYYFSSNRDIAVGGPRNDQGYSDEIAGIYKHDLFAVELQKGEWAQIFPFDALQNTTKNEIIQDFSKDGQVMFYIKSDKGTKGKVYMDTFSLSVEQRAFPSTFVSDFDAENGDKDLHIFANSIMIFSSNRAGGYGGYDLYGMVKVDSIWAPAINLGAVINTEYNEVSPYMTKGGNILHFSSDRIEGLGGYDIYQAEYLQSKNDWGNVKNMVTPINSSKDDLFPLLSSDGNQMIIASDRIGGFGGFDLYMAYLKTQITDQISYAEIPEWIAQLIRLPNTDSTSTANQGKVKKVIEKKSYYVPNLYYTSDETLLSPQNTTIINNLADMMTISPDVKLRFYAHSNIDNQPLFSLFLAMKRAEKIIEILSRKGISKNRFEAVSFGPSYPMVSTVQDRFNNRIEISAFGYNPDYTEIINETPKILDDIKSLVYDKYLNSFSGLYYRINIATTSQVLKSESLNYQRDLMMIRSGDGMYNYYIGMVKNMKEARSLKLDANQQSYPKSTITAFYYGKVISESEAVSLLPVVPELKEFIEYKDK